MKGREGDGELQSAERWTVMVPPIERGEVRRSTERSIPFSNFLHVTNTVSIRRTGGAKLVVTYSTDS